MKSRDHDVVTFSFGTFDNKMYSLPPRREGCVLADTKEGKTRWTQPTRYEPWKKKSSD
jgi:hypothetical protein